MYSYGPPHMAVQKQDDQHEHTFSSYARIRDVVLKTYVGRWAIGRSGERGSGISVLPARYDDDTTRIHMLTQIQANTNTGETGGLRCSDTNAFINFWLQFFDTRRETILTMLAILSDSTNALRITWCLRALSVEIRKPQLRLQRPNLNFNSMAGTRLSACMVQCQPLTLFQNPQILSPSIMGMTSSTLQPHFRSGVYYNNGDCHILCTRA